MKNSSEWLFHPRRRLELEGSHQLLCVVRHDNRAERSKETSYEFIMEACV